MTSHLPLRPTGAVPTVLYVEDQEINVLVMQALVAMRPQVRLLVATTGEEALRLAAGERPDLLLLDLRLPDCHGTQLLEQLRDIETLVHVPAVAVTADVSTDIAGTTFAELWPKPLHVPDTLAALDRLLNLPPTPRRASPEGRDEAVSEENSSFARFDSGVALRRSFDRSYDTPQDLMRAA
jgi:CheY-like chemotaxis protein